VFAQETGVAFYAPEVGSSARSIRLGNIEGFSHLANTVFENPAGMYRIRKFSTSAFTTRFMDEVGYTNVSAAMRMPVGMLGAGLMMTGVDGIPETYMRDDGEFDVSGYFNYRNNVAKLAYQYSVSRYVHVGAAYTYYLTRFHEVEGKGQNLDLGFIIDSDALDFSFAVKNVLRSQKITYSDSSVAPEGYEGTDEEYSSDGVQEQLPLQTVYALRYTMRHFQLFGQLKTVGKERQFVRSFGVNYNPTFLPFFHLSGGYKQFALTRSEEGETNSDINTSYTMGLGLDLFGVSFDYAFEKSEHIEFENKHYFSFGISF
jgi:hypothetical protein